MSNYVRWDLGEVTRRRDYRGTDISETGVRQPPVTETQIERSSGVSELPSITDTPPSSFSGFLSMNTLLLIGGIGVAFLLLRKRS